MYRSLLLAPAFALAMSAPAAAQELRTSPPVQTLTYADLVGLSDAAPLVIKAQIRKQATVEPARAPDLAPGHARLYVEAQTRALVSGNAPLGENLRYLVDLPLDAKGKVPKLKKQEVILFARSVPGRPGELQLVDPAAQLPYSPELEARLRPIWRICWHRMRPRW